MPAPKKTHCLRGHVRILENLGPRRSCKLCRIEMQRERRRTPEGKKKQHEYNARHYSKYRAEIIAKVDGWRRANLDRVRARARARYRCVKSSPEFQAKGKAAWRAYYSKNREAILAKGRAWRRSERYRTWASRYYARPDVAAKHYLSALRHHLSRPVVAVRMLLNQRAELLGLATEKPNKLDASALAEIKAVYERARARGWKRLGDRERLQLAAKYGVHPYSITTAARRIGA